MFLCTSNIFSSGVQNMSSRESLVLKMIVCFANVTKIMQVQTVSELQTLLQAHGIDTGLYGKPGTKSLQNLLKEITEEESNLEVCEGKLKREVHILLVYIKSGDKVLTETNQLFHTTPNREAWSRQRNSVLAEKLHPGENAQEAVRRALEEELGITYSGTNHKVNPVEAEIRTSASYPGLESVYYTT